MSSSDWRLQPLRSFWQSVNWDNRAIAPVSISSNGKVAPTLNYMMSVRDYFRGISWTGIPEIAAKAAEPQQNSKPIDEANETLEDFLDDISNFF